jgi:hypothetical protein
LIISSSMASLRISLSFSSNYTLHKIVSLGIRIDIIGNIILSGHPS